MLYLQVSLMNSLNQTRVGYFQTVDAIFPIFPKDALACNLEYKLIHEDNKNAVLKEALFSIL